MSNSARKNAPYAGIVDTPSSLLETISSIKGAFVGIGKGKTMETSERSKRVQLVLSLPKDGGGELKSKLQGIATENSRSMSNQIWLILSQWVDRYELVKERHPTRPSDFLDGVARLDSPKGQHESGEEDRG
tara:strand:- start:1159 stop:1551 length:393 start_codon:yes stop_codon:yes gene_type:complete